MLQRDTQHPRGTRCSWSPLQSGTRNPWGPRGARVLHPAGDLGCKEPCSQPRGAKRQTPAGQGYSVMPARCLACQGIRARSLTVNNAAGRPGLLCTPLRQRKGLRVWWEGILRVPGPCLLWDHPVLAQREAALHKELGSEVWEHSVIHH